MIKNIPTASIGQLLLEQYPFFIPIYQRAYSWEEEDIEDFINDIRALYEKRLQSGGAGPETHFFGGIICVHHYASNKTGRRHEVVDGQQRLATFTLTIYQIIRALQTLAAQTSDQDIEQAAQAYSEEMRESYLMYKEVELGRWASKHKLTLSKADNIFFRQLLSDSPLDPTRDSHKRIKYAHDKIKQALITPIINHAQMSDKTRLEHLLQLKASVMDDCEVIHIVSDDRQKAYRLFSVLNDRGRNLSDGDLLRAYTLELLEEHPGLQEMVEQYWDKILAGSQSEIDKFLRTYYPSLRGERAPQRDLSDSYRRHLLNFSAPIARLDTANAELVERRIANMANEQDLYLRIKDGEWPYDNPHATAWERDRLYRLSRVLRHELCYPLLLSACRLKEEEFIKMVNILERFVFRYVIIVRAHAATLYKPYHDHSTMIRDDPAIYSVNLLESDLKTLINNRASDELFRAGLEETLKYSRSSTDKRVIKHFLTTLEDYKDWYENGASGKPRTDKISSFDINQVTIEHIYPQNPAVRDIHMEPKKQDIGNLTFWGPNDNGNVGNLMFDQKKERYRSSRVRLTSELSELNSWGLGEFQQRQNKLIDMALKIFSV